MKRATCLIGISALATAAFSPSYATDIIPPVTDSLDIVDVGEPVLDVGENLDLTVAYTNSSQGQVTVTDIELFAQSSTAISSQSVYNWMDGKSLARFIYSIPTNLEVPPGHTIEHTLTIPRENLPWESGEFTWGPRGIEVRAVTDSDVVADRTMIVVASEHDLTPYPASVVVPITDTDIENLTPVNEILMTSEGDPAAFSNVDQYVDQWDHPGVTILADPTLEITPSRAEKLSLPQYDADIAALLAAGRIAQARELGENAVFLPASAPDRETLTLAADLNMQLLISDTELAPIAGLTYTPGALTSIEVDGEYPAIATHAEIGSALEGQLAVGDNPEIELHQVDSRQVAIALSAIHHRQRPNDPRPIVITAGRDGSTDRETALEILDLPWVQRTTLTQISDGDSWAERDFTDSDELARGAITALELTQIDEGLAEFTRLVTIFDNGPELFAAATERANHLLSVLWRSDPAARQAHIAHLSPTAQQMEAITVNTLSTINMISESSALPIQVTNEFSEPVNIVVHLDTPDFRLVAPNPVPVRLEASSTATVPVPVEAHGSGNVDVEVFVKNAHGDLVGSPDILHVRVRADWENVGTAVLAAIVGAVFIFGLIRSIRDGRRSQPIEPNEFVAASRQ
ncbi:hypothetical protein J2S70_000938 [Trueperella bonasi]|uniref:Secreted protein n=1 Tax=Trueperella bonasi TaxID=312286 RepID=A0ABT9NG43_9ACTO|nr:DUF6049 family protein [Trueperella bonasi]MDP9806356.1 hypothetical protein [Trueperella bonasi]